MIGRLGVRFYGAVAAALGLLFLTNIVSVKGGRERASDDLVEQLWSDPASLQPASSNKPHSAVCLVATIEDDWIEEWLIYHRLMGIDRFLLYDSEASPSLARVLTPYIDAGIVTLHHLTYENQSIKPPHFGTEMIQHCTKTYAKDFQWMWHFDVDEFLGLKTTFGGKPAPYRQEGVWKFPLHDLLAKPGLVNARCIPMTRFSFLNVGRFHHQPRDSLIEGITWRSPPSLSAIPGKVIIQSSEQGVLADFVGHECVVHPHHPFAAGVAEYGKPGAYANVQGLSLPDGSPPQIEEPLKIAHYSQRSLADCREKFKHINDPNIWRITNGGARLCDWEFSLSHEQRRQPEIQAHEKWDDWNAWPDSDLVQDTSIRDSWYGQQTSKLMKRLRKGKQFPCRDSTAAIQSIVQLRVPNPT